MKKILQAVLLSFTLLIINSIPAYSSEAAIIETNMIPNWPAGPELDAEAAFLVEANTGIVLYAKNIHEHLYPASTTKMMTALLAEENCRMDETVTFSHDAVFSLEPGSSNIGIDPGQAMPMEECLYGIMVASANEVANAIAEHVSGDIDSFVALMNKKADELGLKDTHFTNTNGLFDEEHYTSAYDLAMIANEFFKSERLSKIGNTARYHFEATATQPDDFYVKNKHQLINGDIPYEGIKGGKTGYTSETGETLVTCAEQNGLKLICVILKETSPQQFTDTVKLFDYGFSNFTLMNVADNEMRYSVGNDYSFPSDVDILGNSDELLSLDESAYIIMPKNIGFDDLSSEIVYDTGKEGEFAHIDYSYNGAYLGYGTVILADKNKDLPTEVDGIKITNSGKNEKNEENNEKIVFINVVNVVYYILGTGITLIVISFIHSIIVNYNFLERFKRKKKTRRRNRRTRDFTF